MNLKLKLKEYQKEIMIFDSLTKESNINEIIKVEKDREYIKDYYRSSKNYTS